MVLQIKRKKILNAHSRELRANGGDRQLKHPSPIIYSGGKNGDCGTERRDACLSLERKKNVGGRERSGKASWRK